MDLSSTKTLGWVFIAQEEPELSTLNFMSFYVLLLKEAITNFNISEVIFLVCWTSVGSHQFILELFIRKILCCNFVVKNEFSTSHIVLFMTLGRNSCLISLPRKMSGQFVFNLQTANCTTDIFSSLSCWQAYCQISSLLYPLL